MITFMFPLEVTVDLGPPQQVTPLSLELFGVMNVAEQNLNINVFDFGPQVVANDVTEAEEAAEVVEAEEVAEAAEAAEAAAIG